MDIGDRVSWDTPQGRTHGKIVERKTKDFQLAKQKFTASDDEPNTSSRARRPERGLPTPSQR
jgi:hypothetical protein